MRQLIPAGATPEVQAAFRAVWEALTELQGTLNVDLHGRRIINAGAAVDAGDYVTKGVVDTIADRVTALEQIL